MHVYKGPSGNSINKVETIGINQVNARVSSKVCKKQLGAFKRIRLGKFYHTKFLYNARISGF